jgi:imidazolonepropionase-like amidohydrolase
LGEISRSARHVRGQRSEAGNGPYGTQQYWVDGVALNFAIRSAALAAVLLASCAAAPDEDAPPTGSATRYVNALWWTGETFEPGSRDVVGGRFVAPVAAPGSIVDLAGAYVTPAFADAHTHLTGKPHNAPSLAAGVFYLKNPNVLGSLGPALKAFAAEPGTIDSVLAMGGLTSSGSHPEPLYTVSLLPIYAPKTAAEMYGDAFHIVDEPRQIDPALDRLQEQGADFVKIYLVNADQGGPGRGLRPAVAAEAVKAAHARGLSVSAHVQSAADFRIAAAAGVDELAHMPGYNAPSGPMSDYLLTDADIALAAEADMRVVTTAAIARQMGMTPARLAEVGDMQRANIQRLRAAGVDVVLGSDSGPGAVIEEAIYLVGLGALTPKEALQLLSYDTPRALFPERKLGRLEQGFEAHFLTFAADPSLDASALRAPTGAWMAGERVVPAPAAPQG